MKFTDGVFPFFLLVVYLGWLLLRSRHQLTMWWLLAASLYFYAYDGEQRLLLLLAYCVVDWWVGRRLAVSPHPRRWLVLGVTFNLALLAFYKYTPMLTRTAAAAGAALGFDWQVPPEWFLEWSIPFGLSFYAFTGIAYLVDVHTGRAPLEPSFARTSLYLTFFPQLMAGPILRPHDFLDQLQPAGMPRRCPNAFEAWYLIGRGTFKKMALADGIGVAIDPYFSHVADASTAGVWALPYLFLYALQIYFDFSGYTDMARGLGLLFGFRWPRNFAHPYLALSIRDFWRRWHMTLSTFLRDYLYIPLGGNRLGELRTGANLMVTMLLGGLWHGASWSFMVWGGLHGLYLMLHRFWEHTRLAARMAALTGLRRWLWRALAWTLTLHAVVLAWAFFRLTSWAESVACLERCLSFDPARMLAGGASDPLLQTLLAVAGVLAVLEHRCKGALARGEDGYEVRHLAPFAQGAAWGVALTLLAAGVLLAPAGEAPAFIYFQF